MNTRRALRTLALASPAVAAGLGSCQLAASEGVPRAQQIAFGTLGTEVFVALAAVVGAALSSQPLRTRLGLGPGRATRLETALLMAGTLGLSHALDCALELSGLLRESALYELERAVAGVRGRALALALLGMGLAPGIAEELLCRGLVQRGLERRLGAPAAVGVAALVFGALHVDPLHALVAVVLGTYLGTVAWLAGSVRLAIACHVLNNLAAVAALSWELDPQGFAWTGLGAGSALAIGALGIAWRRLGARRQGGLQLRTGSDDA